MSGTNPSSGTGLRSIAGGGPRSVLALVVIALLCFLPGFFSLPPIDRDEARFAQSSRQMVETGDWIDIRLQGEPRYKQPVGIYWLQATFASVLGEGDRAPMWVHRLPSLIAAIGAVLLTYWIALALVSREAAFLAAGMMAVAVILGVEARLAKTDATLLATILLAQGVLARAYLHSKAAAASAAAWRPRLHPFIFWTALAAGILVKGPIILLYIGLTVAALAAVERSFGFLTVLRPLPGLAWCLALAIPWYVAIGFHTDGLFYETAIGFSVAGKITQSHEGHGAPPLTHAVWFWGIFWPGSLLFGLAIPEIWRRRREAWLTFLMCWAVPAWLFMEIVTTKLPHYILPALPAVAITTAGTALSFPGLVSGRVRSFVATAIVALLAIVAIAGVVVAAWFAGNGSVTLRLVAIAVLAVLLIGASSALCLRAIRDRDVWRVAAALGGGMIALFWLLYPSLARIDAIWPARELARAIAAYDRCPRPALVSAGYGEPSLVFSTRTDLVVAGGGPAADRMAAETCVLGMIEARHSKAFFDRALEIGLDVKPLAKVEGYNLGGGRWVAITVFERAGTGVR